MPELLVQIALVVVIIHAVYVVVKGFQNRGNPDWFVVVYQISIAVVALWLLLGIS
ncbi:hypothetical protein [Marininema halotolerans]|uniref:Uncharacterized protein n=1 Tax=Marininema halotolerans TaxID=1155944 RepID=A0A1I6U0W4_9BACL|nr:hypothetical protein [Marininema halotolerans]SFS95129.1 hypothetical protein SAMN05444972_11293 [Marininema halotolerans]